METKLYNSNKEVACAINNDTYSYKEVNLIQSFVKNNIDNIKTINGNNVSNLSLIDGSTLEYLTEGINTFQYSVIIQNDIVFN